MKIFVMTTRYPEQVNPQASIFVHEQCKELKDKGHSISVLDPCIITPKYWNTRLKKTVCERIWDGIKIFSFPTRGIATTKLLFLNQFNYILHAIKIYNFAVEKAGKPDIIYAHFSSNAGVAACIIGKMHNIPVAIIEHGGAVMQTKKSFFLSCVLKFVSHYSNRIICVSSAQLEHIKRYIKYTDKLVVVPNMVNRKFSFKPHRKGKPFVFFSAGNLYKVKRMDLLINAFADVFSDHDNVELRIAGDGSEKEKIVETIKSRKLSNRVFLLGRLNQNEIIKEYENCDAFALASEHESFGIAYREAMTVGRPVIATANGGIEENWFSGAGYIVPVGNREKFARAMREVYEKYDEFCLERISEEIKLTTSPDVVIGKIEAILQKCIDDYYSLRRKL